MTDDLTRLKALARAATPGPWRWRNTQEVYLLGERSRVVMAFRRMGMNGAQPEFRGADGLLFPAGRENLHAIPDATYIAAAHPQAVLDLIERLRKAEAEHDEARAALAQIKALHIREIERNFLVEVEGGRATVQEDVDYCAECGDLTGVCRTVQIIDALAGGEDRGSANHSSRA